MRKEEIVQRVKVKGNILKTRKTLKGTWISHTVHRNCLLNHDIERNIE